MSRCTAVAVAAALGLVPAVARAHFVLHSPASTREQGSLGVREKELHCGGRPGFPTGMVTSYAPGDMVTVTINETVAHPGHYRVALSTTGEAGLPADPPVTV